MRSVLIFSFNAVAPIILTVLIGYVARRLNFLDDHSLKVMNRFIFRFCFSCMMFVNLYQMQDPGVISSGLIATILLTLLLLTLASLPLSAAATNRRDRRGVLMQCLFRSNYAIIGLVLAENLAGQEGRELASFLQLPTIIYFNVASVLILTAFSDSEQSASPGKVLRQIATNPLILGLLAGAAALLLRDRLPAGADGTPVFVLSRDLPWLYQVVSYLARLATPLALIIMGGQLSFSREDVFRKDLVAGVLMKLVLSPAIGLTVAFLAARLGLFEMRPAVAATLCAVYGSPNAVASAAMAAEMKADEKLAGQLVVWTSVFSMGTLFVIVSILRGLHQL